MASRELLWVAFFALFVAASGQVTKYRMTVGSNVCDTDAPDRTCCIFEQDDGMDVVDAGANTLLTIESPKETHLSFADGSPAQGAIPPLLARGSYYIGSPTPKPPFLVNTTFPPTLAGLLFHPTLRDINANARILLFVSPNRTRPGENGCFQLVTVKVGPARPGVPMQPIVPIPEVCTTIEPYEQCGGINLCPLCPLRGGPGSDHVCAYPLAPSLSACNGTWPNTCCTAGFSCKVSPGSQQGYDFQCYE